MQQVTELASANRGPAPGAIPRILLLTGTLPGPDGVGSIVLQDLCRLLPSENLAVALVTDGSWSLGRNKSESGSPILAIRTPYPRSIHSRAGKIGRALRLALARLTRTRSTRSAADAIAAEFSTFGVEQVWAVLDSPLLIDLAGAVAARFNAPLRVTVWDDVVHLARYYSLDAWSTATLRARFQRVLETSRSCALIGESMKEDYDVRFGTRSVVLRHGVSTVPRAEREQEGTEGAIRIGFAGSISAPSAFEAFMATLDQMGWAVGEVPVTLRLFGHRFDIRSSVPRRIELYGWAEPEDSLRLLSECQFNYLPQPFEDVAKPLARLSFPTKLSSYLAAGPAVLVHAPEAASLPLFFSRYPFGQWCSSLDTGEIERKIRLLLDPELLAGYRSARDAALAEELSLPVFRRRFAEFLEIDESELAT